MSISTRNPIRWSANLLLTPRLAYALAAFAALMGIAGYLLRGKILYATLLMLGLFLARTLIAAKTDR